MKVHSFITKDVDKGGNKKSHRIGPTSNALPYASKYAFIENFDTGVSTHYIHSTTNDKPSSSKASHWYALRTTYGREKKAYDFIIGKGHTAFYPTITTMRMINGKRKAVKESRIPNIFFAYGTESEIKTFVYDNVNLPFLRFYYHHSHFNDNAAKEPLIVPDEQLESLRIICEAEEKDVILTNQEVKKFRSGQLVKVIDGKFKGVVGTMARYQGQLRVGIIINGCMTAATAYIPSAFIKAIE